MALFDKCAMLGLYRLLARYRVADGHFFLNEFRLVLMDVRLVG